jgi:putative membrane protein
MSRQKSAAPHPDLSPARSAFLLKAMQDTLAEMELCMLALKKSHSQDVLALAETVIEEHGQLGLEMEQLAQEKKLDPALLLSEESMAAIDAIANLPDQDFDRHFVEQNVRDHASQLEIFHRCATREQDSDLRTLAEKGEKMLSRHLQMARRIEERLPA